METYLYVAGVTFIITVILTVSILEKGKEMRESGKTIHLTLYASPDIRFLNGIKRRKTFQCGTSDNKIIDYRSNRSDPSDSADGDQSITAYVSSIEINDDCTDGSYTAEMDIHINHHSESFSDLSFFDKLLKALDL